ncbi:hypothetical protein BU24DRAFT_458947 [Aaosphaeria arxii CBS 175.79]|uniref:Uncharacterized protein n=1 Tax=Aaosphaeria arxii CBS 175.79 TaxID=1450172 RepID=A0A6A5Y203_9PLEO|nr:uncharacterized protein BU24DRAFT_458947 [Aaosphaeria arxii CBS 175.79]KAF2019249.1 hypothetical protein BU24DRAFT_458947 [Aaosphaeria arxii CBS 175.79]
MAFTPLQAAPLRFAEFMELEKQKLYDRFWQHFIRENAIERDRQRDGGLTPAAIHLYWLRGWVKYVVQTQADGSIWLVPVWLPTDYERLVMPWLEFRAMSRLDRPHYIAGIEARGTTGPRQVQVGEEEKQEEHEEEQKQEEHEEEQKQEEREEEQKQEEREEEQKQEEREEEQKQEEREEEDDEEEEEAEEERGRGRMMDERLQ